MAQLVVSLDDPAALDPALVGPKAASVARMRAAGLRVPVGFAVTAPAYERAVAPVLNALRGAGDDAEAARDLVRSAAPDGLLDAVGEALAPLGDGPFAVRSSATDEDLDDASFAGQYDSHLGVRREDVADRVRGVWGSLYSDRAVAYRRQRGLEAGSMAVLVQSMVDAEASGVLFTRDPVTGAEDRIRVNATWGLGEGLVGGEVASDDFVLDAETLEVVERRVATKPEMVALDGYGTARVAVPAGCREAPALDDQTLATLGRLGREVRDLFGAHRDIEFATRDGEVWLLQARPITEPDPPVPFEFEWPDPSEARRSWRLHFAEPARRLEEDLSRLYAKHAAACFDLCGSPMVRRHLVMFAQGWRYVAAPDVDPEELRERQEHWQARVEYWLDRGTSRYHAEIEPELLRVHEELHRARPRRGAGPAARLEYARLVAERAAYTMGDLHWRMVGMPGGGPDLPSVWTEVTGRPQGESAVLLQGIENMTTRLVRRLRGLARLAQSDEALAAAVRARDLDSIGREPLRGREAARRFRSRLRSLLRVYGHHTGHGFGASTSVLEPTWNMEPARVLDVVARYAEADVDELERLERRARRERIAETRKARRQAARDPELLARFQRALLNAQLGVRTMEDHNYLIEQGTSGIQREAIHDLGRSLVRAGWLEQADDVYHLSFEEVEEAIERGGDRRALVAEREAERARRARMQPPQTLGAPPPERDASSSEPPPDIFQAPDGTGLNGTVLRGVPASRGRHTGRARVILKAGGHPPPMERGDVLVARNAGPDWTPVFPLLGGLVLDEGAAFQHAALVAREYGIAAVVMTRDATSAIADGQTVTVDGASGTVELGPAPR